MINLTVDGDEFSEYGGTVRGGSYSKQPEAATRCVLQEKVLLKILKNLQGKKYLCQARGWKRDSGKKIDSGTGVFLWILENF